MATNKYICVHGHFYQPPRENPWLGAVELQDSAAPYHDWNEHVTAECYEPNAYARFVDGKNRIKRIVSNYSQISFDFGPTLLAWLQERRPELHRAIVDADKESQKRFSGHGSAMAQCYNHVIMPLASPRDKLTQTRWGIRDFEARFRRTPEGMWLPECAADEESLDALAASGIKFTILSPYQARRVRPLDGKDWRDVNGGKIDPSQPYLVKLASGRTITVFFYDGPVSRAVAFERLLDNGDRLVQRLTSAFNSQREGPQLVHIATDGESYGHHHRYGEMALAYALHLIKASPETALTNYGEFLELHPPTQEAEIHRPSAWSCPHGVERWRADCGCNSGANPAWNQQWRKPLREALDWLRDQLGALYETKAAEYLEDPWQARDDYIEVVLDRSPENVSRFLSAHVRRALNEGEDVTVLRLLEMQRHAMLMYTSCGWFFDDLSGIETVQIVQYAARAIQLAASISTTDLEPQFLEYLAGAKSNVPGHQDGKRIYQTFVTPSIVTWEMVGAHYAISSLFESYGEQAAIYVYLVAQKDRRVCTAGHARLAVGRVAITSAITRSGGIYSYGVLHMGDHNLTCAVMRDKGDDCDALFTQLSKMFERGDFPEIIRSLDHHFGQSQYSIKSLFRDEQRKVLKHILAATREEVHNTYRLMTDRYAPLMRFLGSLGAPTLPPLEMAMRFVLNNELRRQFESGSLDMERVRSLLAEVELTKVPLDSAELGYAAQQHLSNLSERFARSPDDLRVLKQFAEAASLVRALPFDVDMLRPQNAYHAMQQSVRPVFDVRVSQGDEFAQQWLAQFTALGEALGFRIEKAEPVVVAA